MLRRTEMSLFGWYFHRYMLYSSTKVATRRFVRHLENLGTTTPLFNDIYFRSRVMSQLGGSTVVGSVLSHQWLFAFSYQPSYPYDSF